MSAPDATQLLAHEAARKLGQTLAAMKLPFVLIIACPGRNKEGKFGATMVRANNGLNTNPVIREFLIDALADYLGDTEKGPQGELNGPGKHSGGS